MIGRMVPVLFAHDDQRQLPLQPLMITVIALGFLSAGCAAYSPGEFDDAGPYPVIRFADGTEYELPSGNGFR